jgi:hypothetical protein
MGGSGGIGAVVGAGVGFMIGGPLGAAALGSAGASFGSALDAGAEAEKLAKRNRNLSNEQALEIVRQSRLAATNIMKEGREMSGTQASAFAAGGVDVASGSALLVMEHTAAQYKQDAYETMRSGNYNADNLRRRAQAEVDAAKAGRKAALIGGLANLGLNAAMIGMAAPGTTGNEITTTGSKIGLGQTSAIPTRTQRMSTFTA